MMQKLVIKIDGMHCTSCSLLIDGDLEDTDGIKEANTNYAKQITEVTFEPDKITPDKILSVIKSSGYDAAID